MDIEKLESWTGTNDYFTRVFGEDPRLVLVNSNEADKVSSAQLEILRIVRPSHFLVSYLCAHRAGKINLDEISEVPACAHFVDWARELDLTLVGWGLSNDEWERISTSGDTRYSVIIANEIRMGDTAVHYSKKDGNGIVAVTGGDRLRTKSTQLTRDQGLPLRSLIYSALETACVPYAFLDLTGKYSDDDFRIDEGGEGFRLRLVR